MRKIAVAMAKGGVGKTTTAVNLAYGLASNGKRVLLVDCDTQGQVANFLGEKPAYGLYEFITERLEDGQHLVEQHLVDCHVFGSASVQDPQQQDPGSWSHRGVVAGVHDGLKDVLLVAFVSDLPSAFDGVQEQVIEMLREIGRHITQTAIRLGQPDRQERS